MPTLLQYDCMTIAQCTLLPRPPFCMPYSVRIRIYEYNINIDIGYGYGNVMYKGQCEANAKL